ncbi:MAG: hypothetical protein ACTH07_06465 [Microbacterium sp.]
MDILKTIQNISAEAQITIGIVVGVLIIGAFAVHWVRNRFTLASALGGMATAGLVGWGVAAGVGWFSDGIGGTLENNAAALYDAAFTLTTLV